MIPSVPNQIPLDYILLVAFRPIERDSGVAGIVNDVQTYTVPVAPLLDLDTISLADRWTSQIMDIIPFDGRIEEDG